MRKIIVFAFTYFSFLPAAYCSDFTFVNTASFLSEYYSRGLTQTRGLPAPQFMSTVFYKSGLYGGAFISRVEFLDNHEASEELDFYGGLNKYVDKLNYRVGFVRYTYPNANSSLNYNFTELDLGMGYNFDLFSSELSLRYSPNYFANSGKEQYWKFETKVPIKKNFQVLSHIAYRSIEDNSAFYGLPDNYDWELGVQYQPIEKIGLSLKYVDSSFEKSECFGLCGARIIAGVSYTF